MEKPKSLESIFNEKLFRIPDYQRGYAWQHEQLKDFWEDLVNLTNDKSHYTGVLTLKPIPTESISKSSKEFWLVDRSYQVFHVVDGQQRLTTFIIFLQAFVDCIKGLPENINKKEQDILISENWSLADLQKRYLFEIKPTGDNFRTYKFGYESDNPSFSYLRFRIFGEDGGAVKETFYTLNLSNAKTYFLHQLIKVHEQEGMTGLETIYRKLTRRFLLNEYVIDSEFDVFITFETMNNRGKTLSHLERLKNRLIFLTTLFDDNELDDSSRKSLRDDINGAWKEIYSQLGRHKDFPLNDDDFLRAHWIMYFTYSRKTGQDYIHYLLDKQFTAKRLHKRIEKEILLETPEEIKTDEGLEDVEEEIEVQEIAPGGRLTVHEISDYVKSLKSSAVHWFNTFFPDFADDLSADEKRWINALNRLGVGYFRPLIMSVLKNERGIEERVNIFRKIERFIFISFRMNSAKANYGSSEFYRAARELDRKATDLTKIGMQIDARQLYTFNDDGTFRSSSFKDMLFKKFKDGSGYYGWSALRYLLFEYEISLMVKSRQQKVTWSDLLKSERDKCSIEHIYPQEETIYWAERFSSIEPELKQYYKQSLGNLLLLSMSINSSLQNDDFDAKKDPKYSDKGIKLRCGYKDGSHSEIDVADNDSWGPEQIRVRGLRLLGFMEDRWGFKFRNDEERERLLFLAGTKEGG